MGRATHGGSLLEGHLVDLETVAHGWSGGNLLLQGLSVWLVGGGGGGGEGVNKLKLKCCSGAAREPSTTGVECLAGEGVGGRGGKQVKVEVL